jgi:hypothetical protein
MFRFRVWAAPLLAALIFAGEEAKAGVGFQPVSQEELKMTGEPLAPGAPAIILYRQVDRDDNPRAAHEDIYLRIKILTEEGRKYADVEIPFDKRREDIVSLRARTVRPDGSAVELRGDVLEKNLKKANLDGKRINRSAKVFTLSDVQVGSIVEYSYTRDFHQFVIFNSHWFLNEGLFTRRAQFSLRPFPGAPIRWTWNNLPPGAAPPKQGADHMVRMQVSNIPAFEVEDYMPPANELKARIDFIYRPGGVGKDQEAFWRDLGKDWNGDLESFIGKRSAMEGVVAQIVTASDSSEVKLRQIYDRVQRLRNTSYEPTKTEQEESREHEKGNNVEQVWARAYGSRTQLNWLFLALARAAGFDAYGCWFSDREDYFFSPITKEGWKLDASVVLVKMNGKDLYLSPGAAFTPFGFLPWSETNVPGLRLDKKGGTWIRTALPQASESRIELLGKLKLTSAGDLEGDITVTFTGLEAQSARVDERNADEVDRKSYLEQDIVSLVGPPAEAQLTNRPEWSNSEMPLVAEFRLKVPGWASSTGKRLIIPALVFSTGSKGLFERKDRVHPIYFEFSHERIDVVTIDLPSGWEATGSTVPQDMDAGLLSYSLKVEEGPGRLRMTRKLKIDTMLVDQQDYPDLRNFFQVVRSADAGQILLQPNDARVGNSVRN